MLRSALLILLLLASEGPPKISVSPLTGFAPLTVKVRLWLAAPSNDQVCIIYDSDEGMAGRSCFYARDDYLYYERTLKDLSPGTYEIYAATPYRRSAARTVTILESIPR